MRNFDLSSPPFIFDNDCISSFLWIREPNLPNVVLNERLMIPQMVVDELSFLKGGNYDWVVAQLDCQIQNGWYVVKDILVSDPEFPIYQGLSNGSIGGKKLGKGESAVLAIASNSGGTVASNNLADVNQYCVSRRLQLLSTDDLLCLAVEGGKIAEAEASRFWAEMKRRRRMLPSYDFAEALRRFRGDLPKNA